MCYHKDLISGLVILVLCLIGSLSVAELPEPSSGEIVGTASLPKFSLIALGLCGAFLTIRGFWKTKARQEAKFNICAKSLLFFVFYVVYMIAMVFLSSLLRDLNMELFSYGNGFLIATVLFLLLALPVLGRKKPLEIVAIAVLTTAILAAIFGIFFKVLLP